MADEINIGIKASDGGTIDALVTKAEKLEAIFARLSAAPAVRVPIAVAQAQVEVAASQGVAPRTPTRPRAVAAAAASGPNNTASNTNLSRAVTGSTGAGARDFASEAQGLGGLVHVYATFAANLYAVSAAFGALSKAADTTNMLKGLDQLGAQSGRSLGSLSKQLVEATDGALSLRDAMNATALGTSAGLSADQMLRITDVAKKASLALGRDMVDSMDRLTKGVVKIQPELLDELGIMTRVIPAQEAYAKQIGKSVASLSTFEKQQAWANAVLAEGEKKFSAIKIDTNPYTQLSSSLANLAQSFLSIVNTPVSGVISVLTHNTLLLGLAVAAVGKALLSMALPELMKQRFNYTETIKKMKDATEFERQASNAMLENLRAEIGQRDALHGAAAREVYIKKKKSLGELSNLEQTAASFNTGIIGKKTAGLLSIDTFRLSNDEMASIKERSNFLLKTTDAANQAEGKRLSDHLDTMHKFRTEADQVEQAATDQHMAKDVKNNELVNTLQKKTAESNKKYALENIKNIAAETAARDGLLAGIRKSNQLIGEARKAPITVKTGITPLGAEITEIVPKLNFMDGAALRVGSAIGMIGNAAKDGFSTLLGWASKLGEIGMIIAAADIVWEIFFNLFSGNKEELEKFSKSLDSLSESSKTVHNTLAVLSDNEDPLSRISISAISAKSNAFNTLAETIGKVTKDGEKAASKMVWVDQIADSFKKLYGGDIASQMETSLSTAIEDSFNLLKDNTELQDKFVKNIGTVLKIPNLDIHNIDWSKLSPTQLTEAFKLLPKAIQASNTEFGNFNSSIKDYTAAADAAVKATQDFNLANQNNDPMYKMGSSLLTLSSSLVSVTDNADKATITFINFIKDTSKLALLTPDVALGLVGMKNGFLENASAIQENINKVNDLRQALVEAEKQENSWQNKLKEFVVNALESNVRGPFSGPPPEAPKKSDTIRQDLVASEKLKDENESKRRDLETEAAKKLSEIQFDTFVRGSEYIKVALGNVGLKIGVDIDKALTSGLTGARAALANVSIAERERDITQAQIDATYNNTIAQNALTLAIQENNALQTLANEEKKTGRDRDTDKIKRLQIDVEAYGRAREIIRGPASGIADATRASLITGKARGIDSNDPEIQLQRKVGSALLPSSDAANQASIKTLEARGKVLVEQAKAAGSLAQESYLRSVENSQFDSASLKLQADKLNIANSILDTQSEALVKQKQTNEVILIEQKGYQDQEAIKGKIVSLEAQLKLTGDEKLKQQISEEIALEKTRLIRSGTLTNSEKENKLLQNGVDLMNIRLAKLKQEQEYRKLVLDQQQLQATNILEAEQARVNGYVQLNSLSEHAKASISAQQANASALLQFNQDSEKVQRNINDLKDQYNEKVKALPPVPNAKDLAEGRTDPYAEQRRQNLENETAAIKPLQKQLDIISDTYYGKKQVRDITSETALQIAKENDALKQQSDYMQSLVSTTENLAALFGNVGDAIGKSLQAIQSVADAEDNYSRNKIKYNQLIEAGSRKGANAEALTAAIDATKQLEKLEKNRVQEKLRDDAKVFNESKKMFEEGSIAYKVLNGLEKKNHLEATYNAGKEAAIKMGFIKEEQIAEAEASLKSLALKASNVLEGIGIDIPGIYASFMDVLGPFGPPAAAAAIGMFLGGAGSGAGSAPFSYDDYKKQQNYSTGTGGVAGDSSAANTGLTKALDILSAAATPQLQLTSLMAVYLKSIDSHIQNIGIGIQGANGGSMMNANGVYQGQLGGPSGIAGSVAGAVLGSVGFTAGVGAVTTTLINGAVTLGASLAGLSGIAGEVGVQLATSATTAAIGASSLATTFAELGSVVPGIGTAIGAVVGLLLGSMPAVQNWIAGSSIAFQSVAGFGAEIKDQTLGMAASNLQVEKFTDVLVHTVNEPNLWQRLTGTGETASDSVAHVLSPADERFVKALQAVYGNIQKSLTAASSLLDVSTTGLSDFKISLTDIDLSSGTDAEKLTRLQGAIGDAADSFARKLMPSIDNYTQAGETAYTAYLRLASAQEKATYITNQLGIATVKFSQIEDTRLVSAAAITRESIVQAETWVKGIGSVTYRFIDLAGKVTLFTYPIDTYAKSLSNIATIIKDLPLTATEDEIATYYVTLKNIEATFTSMGYSVKTLNENLINGAGGLSALSTSLATFEDKFLSSSEKLTIEQAKVDIQFKRLGLTTPKTAQEFTNLVKGLMASGESSGDLLGKVLNLSDGMSNLFDLMNAGTKTLSDLDLALAKLDQQIKIYDLLNNSEAALALTRQKELDAMDERLRPTQLYIYALEDEAKIRDTLSNKLKTNITNLKGFITSLNSAKDQLLLGAQSTLTPGEKYAEAKAQLDALKQAIATTGTDDASIAARDAALSKLPAATTSFLDASKTLYASSGQYSQDFANATDYLKTTVDKLTLAKTDAEVQLAAVETGNTSLAKIDLNTKSTAELMKMLTDASAKTVTAAAVGDVHADTGKMYTSNEKIVNDLYKSLFNRVAEKEGLDYWTNKLDTKALTADTLKSTLQTYLPIHHLTADSTASYIKDAIRDGMTKDAAGTFNEINSRGYSSQQVADFLSITKDEVLAWAKANNLGSFAADTAKIINTSLTALTDTSTAVVTASTAVTTAASTATTTLTTAGTAVITAGTAVTTVGTAVTTAGTALTDTLTTAVNTGLVNTSTIATGSTTGTSGTTSSIVDSIVTTIGTGITTVIDTITSAVTSTTTGTGIADSIISTIGGGINTVLSTITSTVTGTTTGTGIVDTIVSTIGGGINTVLSTITSAVTTATSIITDTGTTAAAAITDTSATAAVVITDTGTTAAAVITDTGTTAVTAITDTSTTATTAITDTSSTSTKGGPYEYIGAVRSALDSVDRGIGDGTGGYDAFGGSAGDDRACPAPWINITLADGSLIQAGDVKPGMQVYTCHEITGEWGNFTVTHVSMSEDTRWKVVFQEGTEFVGTFDHRILTDYGWVQIDKLQVGDKVVTPSGFITVKSTNFHDFGAVVKITVEDAHTYLTEGFVSHNIKPNAFDGAKAFNWDELQIQPFAAGGIASGMSLVGEQGPELADFQRPARIYSNGDTKDLFNNKELVAEIKALREEVAKLREDQHEQTGHLIASTYDANSKASTRVAAATENATINASWKDRSAVKIA